MVTQDLSSRSPAGPSTQIHSASAASAACLLASIVLAACGGSSSTTVIRLVDRFQEDMVQNSPTQVARSKSADVWNFSDPGENSSSEGSAALGWKTGIGVTGLILRDGRLRGRSTTNVPIIYLERKQGLDTPDLLHAIEVRAKASKGTRLMVHTAGEDDIDFENILKRAKELSQPMRFSASIAAGDDIQTLTLRTSGTVRLSSIHKLLIRPSDEPEADFEIESVRLISRREHLGRIPSGVSWQGLAEKYRETLVARAPESIVIDVELPANPWLDLHVGTLEAAPVKFEVRVSKRGEEPAAGVLLLEKTVTTADRWEQADIDLSEFAGREVALSLSLSGAEDGALGFWGTSAIRTRGGVSPDARAEPPVDLVVGEKPPQGVILIVTDTLRRGHLNPWGYERDTSPTLEKFASQGALFRDNITQATWTKVSVTSILSSLYPASHGVQDVADRLPAAAETLAEVYRKAGYATVSYSSVPFSGKLTNLHQGFEEVHERDSLDLGDYGSKTGREYVDRLSEWLGRHRDEPFFVFLHVFDPHSPFEPRPPYNTIWSDPEKREAFDQMAEKLKKVKDNDGRGRNLVFSLKDFRQAGVEPAPFVSYAQGWYDASIRALDAEIARLQERLRGLGLADKTLIAFTSDHGEEFHEHGSMWHGQTVYGELANVPLMFYGPSFVPGGLTIDETVQNIDIMPTLLELSRLPLPEKIQGQSLVPLMVAARDSPNGSDLAEAAGELGWQARPALTQKASTTQTGGPTPYDDEQYSLVSDGWKFVHNVSRAVEVPEFELFAHKTDPLNLKNVAGAHPEVVERLREQLTERREFAASVAFPESSSTEGLSDEELQRLKSLGYIQ